MFHYNSFNKYAILVEYRTIKATDVKEEYLIEILRVFPFTEHSQEIFGGATATT